MIKALLSLFRKSKPPRFSKFHALVYTEYLGHQRLRWDQGFEDAKEAEQEARRVASRCDWMGVDPRGNPVAREVGIAWAVVPATVVTDSTEGN